MNITVAGTGYVGLSSAVLLAQKHNVIALDVVEEKVAQINRRVSPIDDTEIQRYLNSDEELKLKATLDKTEAYRNAEVIIIATPTDYDPRVNYFNTKSIESVVEDIMEVNDEALIVIKSTIPVGYTDRLKEQYKTDNIIFSPEFLREGYALHDNLFPSRIIVGDKSEKGEKFAGLLKECAIKSDVDVLLVGPTEAEAIKLFSNTYLAMRVAYFNELDSYAEVNSLNTSEIIRGVELEPRIGKGYNNPSFGYGGYCFPKDTRQLSANFHNVPHSLISSVVESNEVRIKFIASRIIERSPKMVGIYRLVMKSGSDNFRSSSIQRVVDILIENGIDVIIYEPMVKETMYKGLSVVNNIDDFKHKSDVIVANRISDEILDCQEKLYTRDVFNTDS